MRKTTYFLFITVISLLLLSACSTTMLGDSLQNQESSSSGVDSTAPRGSASSHFEGNPDYETVFPQENVNEITIQITPENWQAMLDDMTANYGEQGSGDKFNPAGAGGVRPGRGERVFPGEDAAGVPPRGAQPAFPGGDENGLPDPGAGNQRGGGIIAGGTDDENPVWVEAEILFEGESWQHVGIRFKGNSSLRSTWSSGSLKLPFKLDFDQFEDEYPKTEDQRFYGFKQLSFSSNFRDDSYLREKVTADLFREAGVPSAQTAFYAVSIDYGEGPVYLGLYTAVEVVDDTVIETQFGDDSGNVYKPEGIGATFAAGAFTEASFDKETNQEQEDYSDILALYEILHSELRLTDPEAWRAELEAVFDVDTFLNWLAVNTTVQNWDTYGVMNHNYYLYNDPETGQLVWIPWDNNESLKQGEGVRPALSIDLSEAGANWPLISYLRDDPVYFQRYQDDLESFLSDGFVEDELADTFLYYHDLIAPYVLDEDPGTTLVTSLNSFGDSVAGLMRHVQKQINIVETFLEK